MRITKNDLFWPGILSFSLIGFVLGYKLSAIPKLQTPKLLNIAGLLYDLLGVLVLSELVSANARWKKLSVEVIAPLLLYLHSTVPFGAFIGGTVAGFVNRPSSTIVSHFA